MSNVDWANNSIDWSTVDGKKILSSVDKIISQKEEYPDTGIIMKRNYNEDGQIESVQILNETHTVYKNRIVLNQIPTTYYRVKIAGMKENITNDYLQVGEFKVAYDAGIVFFPNGLEGKEITVAEYYGCGIELIPVSRIYTDIDMSNGADDVESIQTTLYDIIKTGSKCIVACLEAGDIFEHSKQIAQELKTRSDAATGINNELKENVAKATPVSQSLSKMVEQGTEQIVQLTELEKEIKSDIATGTPLQKELVEEIAEATSLIQNLEKDIPTATTINKDLGVAIKEANELNSKLGEANTFSERLVSLTQEVEENKEDISKIQNSTMSSGNLIPYSDFRPLRGITSSEYGFAERMTGIAVEEGKTYTLTVCGCISQELHDAGGYFLVDVYDNEWSSNGCTVSHKKDTTPTVYTTSFTATKTEFLYITTYAHPKDGRPTNSNTTNETATIYWYCFVEGTQAGNWIESPYEFGSGVNLFSASNLSSQPFKSTQSLGNTLGVTDVELTEGVIYTLTAYGKASSGYNGTDAYFNSIYDCKNELCPYIQFDDINPKVKSVTFRCKQTGKYSLVGYDNNDGSESIQIYWYTLCEGSEAKAWTPSLKEMMNTDELDPLGFAVNELQIDNKINTYKNKLLGRSTVELALENEKLQSQNATLGRNTVELTLSNQKLKQQNEELGESIVRLILKNDKLLEQVETLAKVIVQNQLKQNK